MSHRAEKKIGSSCNCEIHSQGSQKPVLGGKQSHIDTEVQFKKKKEEEA